VIGRNARLTDQQHDLGDDRFRVWKVMPRASAVAVAAPIETISDSAETTTIA
jgi:hypothetical protein